MSRFIWQFELSGKRWEPQGDWQKETHKWEIRYFWPIEQIVQLDLNERQLNWDKGACKIHQDIYWLNKDNPLNIKQRHDKLVYKAIQSQHNERAAYDKKVNISMNDLIQQNHVTIPVDKMAIQLVIHEKPKCVLELSKIYIQDQVYSSLCIESRCGGLLDDLHNHLHLPGKACSYIEFLSKRLTA